MLKIKNPTLQKIMTKVGNFFEKHRLLVSSIVFVVVLLIVMSPTINMVVEINQYKNWIKNSTVEERQEYFINGESKLKNGKILIYDVTTVFKEKRQSHRRLSVLEVYEFDLIDSDGNEFTGYSLIDKQYFQRVIIGDSNKYIVDYNDLYVFSFLQLTEETYNKLEEQAKLVGT